MACITCVYWSKTSDKCFSLKACTQDPHLTNEYAPRKVYTLPILFESPPESTRQNLGN